MRKAFYVLSLLSVLVTVATAVITDPETAPESVFDDSITEIPNIVGGDVDLQAVDTLTSTTARVNVRKDLKRRPRAGGKNPLPGGKGTDGKTPPPCKCRRLKRNKNAVCYDMEVPLKPYGRCVKRKCGAQYECVFGGGREWKNCIRRIATHDVKLRHVEGRTLLCNTFKLLEPKVFYTLYA